MPEFIHTDALAKMLGVTPETVTRWRMEGQGPKWVRLSDGRSSPIRYDMAEVRRWLAERTNATAA